MTAGRHLEKRGTGARGFSYRIARRLFLLATRRLDKKTERVVRLVVDTALRQRLALAAMFAANLAAALLEGSSMSVLAVAVATITGGEGGSLQNALGPLGELASRIRGDLDRERFFLLLVAVAVIGQVLRAALQYAGTAASSILRTSAMQDLQKRYVRQLMRMSYSEINKHPAGLLIAYNSKMEQTARLVTVLNEVTLSILLLIAYLFVLFWVSWKITVLAIVLTLLFSFLLRGVVQGIRQSGKALVNASIDLSKRLSEYFQVPKLLRVYGQERRAVAASDVLIEKATLARRKGALLNGTISPLLDSVTILFAGGALIGGYFVLGRGNPDVLPMLLAFLMILQRLMARVTGLNKIRGQLAQVQFAAEAVAEFLRTDNKTFTRSGGNPVARFDRELRFENVWFRYPGATHDALTDISFSVKRGEVVALVGPSGAGKSTIIDLMLGLYEPTKGRILMDGLEIGEANVRQWRARFGVVSQDHYLFNASIRENIAFGRPESSMEDISEAARVAHVDRFVGAMPAGFDTHVGDRGHKLSGGQLQRVALARAVLRNSEILILDEATSALDSRSERHVIEAIESLRGTSTIIQIAHRLSTIVRADRILLVEHGMIQEQGTHAALIEKGGLYSELWRLQTAEQARCPGVAG